MLDLVGARLLVKVIEAPGAKVVDLDDCYNSRMLRNRNTSLDDTHEAMNYEGIDWSIF